VDPKHWLILVPVFVWGLFYMNELILVLLYGTECVTQEVIFWYRYIVPAPGSTVFIPKFRANFFLYFSPETDSGSESLKLSCSTPSQAFHYSGPGMPEAANNPDPLAALTSSFKVPF
jgi:hypothetical protein